MKFGEHLFNNAIPEWRAAYVDYKRLKKLLKAIGRRFPKPVRDLHPMVATDVPADFRTAKEEEDDRLTEIQSSEEEKIFLTELNDELTKINNFFKEQLEQALKTEEDLEAQLAALYVAHQTKGTHTVVAVRDRMSRTRTRAVVRSSPKTRWQSLLAALRGESFLLQSRTKQLEKVFKEYYRHLDMLKAYRDLNNTAFYKILKKHDKVTGLSLSPSFMEEVNKASFMTSKLEKEIRRIEQIFTERLEHGNRRRAMQKLRVPEDAFHLFSWDTFFVGAWATFFMYCMLIIVIIAFHSNVNAYQDHRVMFAMYRGLLYPLIMISFVSVNMYIWRKYHVNYVLIFGLDHRNHTNFLQMLNSAGLLIVLWCLSVYLYIFQGYLSTNVSPWSALALFCALFIYWAKPWGSMRAARHWLAKVIGRILAAPFIPVRFEDFWLADQFNSMTLVLLDLEFIICMFIMGNYNSDGSHCRGHPRALRAIIAALPPWWRLQQCLRRYRDTGKYHHLHNGLKYTSSIVVVVFSQLASVAKDSGRIAGESPTATALFVLWILSALVNTGYATFWDLTKDWGLFAKDAKYPLLRKDLLYPKTVYYIAMVNNVMFRLSWTLSISVGYFDFFFSDGLVAVIAFFEMFRRFCWNFFRLENEHLNNCGEFRAVRLIPMPFEYAPADGTADYSNDADDDDDDQDLENEVVEGENEVDINGNSVKGDHNICDNLVNGGSLLAWEVEPNSDCFLLDENTCHRDNIQDNNVCEE